jgi:hypothetical protein
MTQMLQRHRHIIIFLLLFSYLLLGAVGYLETLTICGFWANQHITKPADNPSSTFKVYYTQYKHIPSTVKVSVPSPAVFTPPEVPRVCTYGIIFIQGASNILPDPTFSLHSSRAPPQI